MPVNSFQPRSLRTSDAIKMYLRTASMPITVGDDHNAKDGTGIRIVKYGEKHGIRSIGYVRHNDPSGIVSFANFQSL